MHVLVESGKLNEMSMATLLLRKLDWTDLESVKWLLDKGANPNLVSYWMNTALGHSLQRDNDIRFIETLLDHGANPMTRSGLWNSVALAAGMGRGDALRLFEERGFPVRLEGDLEFLAACALGDRERAVTIATHDPALVERIESMFPVAAHFAGAGNTEGLRILLDVGFSLEPGPSMMPHRMGHPLHVAVWRERTPSVKLLLERGADPSARDASGKSAVDIARLAQTEISEWTPHHSREILEMLESAP
jgi:hypothetical protein